LAITPSISIALAPRVRLQLAFQSVVSGLVEAALLFAEQLGEVVGRGGEVGRLLGHGRFASDKCRYRMSARHGDTDAKRALNRLASLRVVRER
jgi:hypothetical protein